MDLMVLHALRSAVRMPMMEAAMPTASAMLASVNATKP